MNIVSVLNKLKTANLISNTEEGITLFSDCFNKFGISLLLLHDEEEFGNIVDMLVENKIPLQKSNGMYNLRVFAVSSDELRKIIASFKDIGELDFLRQHPEMLAAPKNIKTILTNMKRIAKSSYYNGSEYNLDVLLMDIDKIEQQASSNDLQDVNSYLKTVLQDSSIVDKFLNGVANDGEEDNNIALELQKVENKICEEYLFPVDDEWKIIIDKKEVNTFQNIKDTINKIIELNFSISYIDALLFVLFYQSELSVSEIQDIIKNHFSTGGM